MRTQKTKCQTQQSDMRADFGASLVCTGPYLLMWGTGMDLGKSHQPVYCTCVECWVGLGWVCVCVCGVSRAGRWIRVESIMRRLETGSRESHIVIVVVGVRPSPATMNLTCSASETKDGYPSG